LCVQFVFERQKLLVSNSEGKVAMQRDAGAEPPRLASASEMQSRGAVAVTDEGRGSGGDARWGESDDIELSLGLSIGGCFGKMQSMPLLHIELRRGPRI
jgi:hypothetical protein